MATKRSVGTLKEADLKGKSVFVSVDLSVPLDDNSNITDDTRIRAAVPTIKYLMVNGSRVLLCSHLGRRVTPKFSLKILVPRLSELLGVEVVMANNSIGEEVQKLVAALPEGGVLLLENVRFYKEEEKNDPEFAKKLAALADLYVNDAFGTAHRAHASTEGVAKYLKPSELDYLVGAVANPKKPFAAIVGGSKVSTKIGVIESLLSTVDILLLGGGMIYTFYKAQGHAVGSSLLEEDKLDLARSLMEKAKSKGVSLLLPTDVVIADKFAPDANSKLYLLCSLFLSSFCTEAGVRLQAQAVHFHLAYTQSFSSLLLKLLIDDDGRLFTVQACLLCSSSGDPPSMAVKKPHRKWREEP
ncbi:hypothetical protein YC2023_078412 [Brassica napus]